MSKFNESRCHLHSSSFPGETMNTPCFQLSPSSLSPWKVAMTRRRGPKKRHRQRRGKLSSSHCHIIINTIKRHRPFLSSLVYPFHLTLFFLKILSYCFPVVTLASFTTNIVDVSDSRYFLSPEKREELPFNTWNTHTSFWKGGRQIWVEN